MCPSRIQTDEGMTYMSAGINNFLLISTWLSKSTPYNPESNSMAECLIRSLKYSLSHVNKYLGFNLQ